MTDIVERLRQSPMRHTLGGEAAIEIERLRMRLDEESGVVAEYKRTYKEAADEIERLQYVVEKLEGMLLERDVMIGNMQYDARTDPRSR